MLEWKEFAGRGYSLQGEATTPLGTFIVERVLHHGAYYTYTLWLEMGCRWFTVGERLPSYAEATAYAERYYSVLSNPGR